MVWQLETEKPTTFTVKINLTTLIRCVDGYFSKQLLFQLPIKWINSIEWISTSLFLSRPKMFVQQNWPNSLEKCWIAFSFDLNVFRQLNITRMDDLYESQMVESVDIDRWKYPNALNKSTQFDRFMCIKFNELFNKQFQFDSLCLLLTSHNLLFHLVSYNFFGLVAYCQAFPLRTEYLRAFLF